MQDSEDLDGEIIAEKYELLRPIGRGGMGVVYEARNLATLRRCAVKVLRNRQLAADDEVVKRFLREARAGGVIESEHVVPVFDSGIDRSGRVYLVMERLEGEDLRDVLKRVGMLSSSVAAKIALQTAIGLAKAHALGIIHRDVKPANIFLSQSVEGELKVKILDFGVAKLRTEIIDDSANTLTVTGSLLGTPPYMSPEQVRRASAIDQSADVWSLGIVLWECLTGCLPWGPVVGMGELIAAILTNEIRNLQDVAPWVDPNLSLIVMRALSRDPAARYLDAAELSSALRPHVDSTKLSRADLIAPNEEERARVHEKLGLADTVRVSSTPSSSTPVVVESATRERLRALRAGVAVTAIGLLVAWTAHFWPKRTPAVRFAASASPSALVPSSTDGPKVEASANRHIDGRAESSASERYGADASISRTNWSLEVSPRGAEVSIDDVSTDVHAGHVEIRGPVGSVHLVRVTYRGISTSQRVAISNDGLIPSFIQLDARSVGRSVDAVSPRTSRPVSSDLDAGLDIVFE